MRCVSENEKKPIQKMDIKKIIGRKKI